MRSFISVSLGLVMACSAAWADYPDRPITVIVPASAGGTTDVGVRTWAPYLERCLGDGATITVLNRPGAGQMIGLTEIKNAAPDGYTLGSITMPNLAVSAVTGKGDYTAENFVVFGSLYASTVTLAVRKDSDLQSLGDLVEKAKGSSTPFQIGLGGIAGDDHLTGLRFTEVADLNATFIPFGDAAQNRNALLGGHVEVSSLSVTETTPFLDQLRVLAVGAEQRLKNLPDVPTFREEGFDVVGGGRHSIGGPRGIPSDIEEKLTSCFDEIAADPEFLAEAEKRSLLASPMNAEETQAYIDREYEVVNELWKTKPW